MNPTAIEIRGLHKHYGSVHALRGVHLVLPSGTVGLLGPNGAGKTTLLKLLLGMLAPDGGQARIADLDPAKASERLAIRQRVGYMPESDCLVPGMSAVELVALMGRLAGMPRTDAMTRAHEVLDYVGTGEERYRKNEEYSTGMKQRIKLAQALVHDPPILLLDEPTNGLDPKGRRFLLDLVADLGRNQGKHVLLCTHLLRDVERTCEHVVVLKGGQVVQQGDLADLTAANQAVVRVTVTGDSAGLVQHLREQGSLVQPVRDGVFDLTMAGAPLTGDDLVLAAARHRTVLTGLEPQRTTLEQAFLAALEDRGVAPAEISQ
ncbi:MAG: ABC transporter ATP-binding protein [Planctomycetota bacterium]